jgi:tRNA pseudouridine55 synthase
LSRRRKGEPVHGIVLLDKPAGLSSNQALQRVRRLFNARKAGHTGTLDPFATGLLPICLGEASKTTAFLLDAVKAYRAEAVLGQATSTGDLEGEVVDTAPVPDVSVADIESVLGRFTGDLEQVPPMYSALKHEGKPLYEYARQGITVPRKARPVTIHRLRLLEWTAPRLGFEVVCSKGTYVRTLAEDIAAALGTVGHLVALRRLRVGPFGADDDAGPASPPGSDGQPGTRDPVTLESLEAAAREGTLTDYLLPVDAGLPDWPVVRLDEAATRVFRHGNPAPAGASGEQVPHGLVRVRDPRDRPLGLGEFDGENVQPRRVFQLEA